MNPPAPALCRHREVCTSRRPALRNRAAVLAALLAAAAAPPAAAAVDYALVPKLAARMLRVEADDGTGRLGVGTGVMVAPGSVVTNCHVTRNAVAIRVLSGGRRWAVRAQAADPLHDVCVLTVPDAPDLTVPLASRPPHPGDEVLAVGLSGGIELRFGFGEVKAVSPYEGAGVIHTAGIFLAGASGGGLFNERGELIGIMTFHHPGLAHDASHFSVPVAWIQPQLEPGRAGPVAPLPAQPAFWEHERSRQPLFLQAAALEAEGEWAELARLAQRWSETEPGNAGAWRSLGRAQLELGLPAEARASYRRAVELSPEDAHSWVGLARACRATGDAAGEAAARETLARINPRLERSLDEPR